MPARQSAGDMIRSVSYAANSVGGAAFQLSYTALWTSQFTVFGEEFSDDSRKTPLTLDVPLASASSYHTIDMKRILRAFTRQTKMREPQRQLATWIHPCWRSLTILTPVIPRPRQGSTGRRAAAEAPGRNGGLQRGTLKAELLSSVCALDPNDSPTVIVPGDLLATALELVQQATRANFLAVAHAQRAKISGDFEATDPVRALTALHKDTPDDR